MLALSQVLILNVSAKMIHIETINGMYHLLTLFESPVSKVLCCGEDGTNVLETQLFLTFKVMITSGPGN